MDKAKLENLKTMLEISWDLAYQLEQESKSDGDDELKLKFDSINIVINHVICDVMKLRDYKPS